jgi:hypothetical protein
MGSPDLLINKNGKIQKTLPAALKKDPKVIELKQRITHLKRQSSRMRLSLETAMCRGDVFTASELKDLMKHPLLSPILSRLILTGEKMGYPTNEGSALKDYKGETYQLDPDDKLRIAHPVDLLKTGEWSKWQAECFESERIQFFKQIFRELYILTETEKNDLTCSYRYQGHQVQPAKSTALLGSRSWVNHPDEGTRRTFHDENITAHLNFNYGFFTPAEVEGLTIESICFTERGDWTPVELDKVPPRIFSEVMRDLDLVVSVAHAGGVDPEATASTVEMRASLITQTQQMLKLDNIRIKDNRVFIDGTIGNYTVHLGSGVVHKLPGGQICMVPVHSQHRGRIFLPFADNDPKTAEIISKVIMLAKDKEIKDPTILEQIKQ